MNLKKRIINKAKRILVDVSFITNQNNSFLGFLKNKKGVLQYHGIDSKGNKLFNYRFLNCNSFEKQLIFFKKHCNIVSINDYFSETFDKNKINLLITFDDGYANIIKYAVPLLIKYNLPATVFVTKLNNNGYNFLWTDYIDIAITLTDHPVFLDGKQFVKLKKENNYYLKDSTLTLKDYIILNQNTLLISDCLKQFELKDKYYEIFKNNYEYWQLLSDGDIKYLSSLKQITIGIHTHNHYNLANIPLKMAVDEVIASKKYLENLTKRSISALAFPYGYYNQDIVNALLFEGIKYLFVNNYKYNEEDTKINPIKERTGIYPVYSTNNIIYNSLLNAAKSIK